MGASSRRRMAEQRIVVVNRWSQCRIRCQVQMLGGWRECCVVDVGEEMWL